MSDFFAKNLQTLLDKTGMSVYDLAPKIATEPSTIYRWLNPEVGSIPRARTRVALANVFGVDPNRLVYEPLSENDEVTVTPSENIGNTKTSVGLPIPLLAHTRGLIIPNVFDNDVGLVKDDLSPCADSWLPAAPDSSLNNENLVVVRMPDDSMAPIIKCGDLVYVEFEFQTPMDFENNDLVLADRQLSSGDSKKVSAIIRKLVYGDHPGDAWLVATNTEWPGTRQVRASILYGKVVAIFRKL